MEPCLEAMDATLEGGPVERPFERNCADLKLHEQDDESGEGAPCTMLATGFLSSGDLARLCRTTVRTVRFYEEAGLVQPISRTEGGHRCYEPVQVQRLLLIMDLREAGVCLQEIRDLFELRNQVRDAGEASKKMSAALRNRIDELQRKIVVLRRLRDELTSMAAALDECGSCGTPAFPKQCKGCDVATSPDAPRAMRLLWGE